MMETDTVESLVEAIEGLAKPEYPGDVRGIVGSIATAVQCVYPRIQHIEGQTVGSSSVAEVQKILFTDLPGAFAVYDRMGPGALKARVVDGRTAHEVFITYIANCAKRLTQYQAEINRRDGSELLNLDLYMQDRVAVEPVIDMGLPRVAIEARPVVPVRRHRVPHDPVVYITAAFLALIAILFTVASCSGPRTTGYSITQER